MKVCIFELSGDWDFGASTARELLADGKITSLEKLAKNESSVNYDDGENQCRIKLMAVFRHVDETSLEVIKNTASVLTNILGDEDCMKSTDYEIVVVED